jgi:hypothetical protein
MINMTLKWHDIDICNKIYNFKHGSTWFLARLIMTTPKDENLMCSIQLFSNNKTSFTLGGHNFLSISAQNQVL